MKSALIALLAFCLCLPLMGDDAAKKKFEETKANAEKGDAAAEFSLGIMYFKGHGVSQDHKEAVKWYRKSSEQGDAGAQYALGYLYYNGKGVKENRITAYAMCIIASANGNGLASVLWKPKLEKQMTPEQIAEGQKLSKEMIKKNPKLINE